MHRTVGDLKMAGYKYITNLLHPKENILLSDLCRKGNTFVLVEKDIDTKERLIRFKSKRLLLKYIREEYSFAHAKKAQYMIKGVQSNDKERANS